jgi:primosomal protein N' (replication factor Y)
MYATIALPQGILTYSIPGEIERKLKVGCGVVVPIYKKRVFGYVISIEKKSEIKEVKAIISLLDEQPLISQNLLKLGKWMSSYYVSPLGTVLKGMVPPEVRKLHKRKKINPLSENKGATYVPSSFELTYKQRMILNTIVTPLRNKVFKRFLLHGVTSSGKTEIYIRCIREALSIGRGAILLLPEISLTPQTFIRIKERFGKQVAILHSRLRGKERREVWYGIRDGIYNIVVGPRSAIFAPLRNLGIIIVDEEHSGSYKQEDTHPRYNARDVAIMRAKIELCVCVLGSATPSIESFYNAKKKKYSLLTLPERIDKRPLPHITIIDMRKERSRILSELLIEKIDDRLKKGEEVILFIGRRGFSNFLLCRDCGYIPTCPNCSVTLTYHREDRSLRCHYCGFKQDSPAVCEKCGGTRFKYSGFGTERVEKELTKIFPDAKVLRMDLDTAKRRDSHREIFDQFRRGEAQILLGTQMVTKSFDFPDVTLVGVLSCDTILSFPDFRVGERTFDLLLQVAGRAGRGEKGGEVVLQTYNPNHYVIQLAKNYGYTKFYNLEIEKREKASLPPFCHLLRLVFESSDSQKAKERSHIVENLLEEMGADFLGPAPCPMEKKRGKYRWHILIKTKSPVKFTQEFTKKSPGRLIIDVDPQNMM